MLAATRLAREAGLDARFVHADVYDAPAVLGEGCFDVVYTGLGALNWLPDLGRWAGVVASLLAPGGFLYLAEFHPLTWILADEDLTVVRDYFTDPRGERFDDPGTYAELELETVHDSTREWNHPLGEVIGELLAQGFRLELFREHDFTLFPRWEHLERDPGALQAGEVYRQPEGSPRLPLMYSLRAAR